jgi:F-type H+-transporting ATPase subunit epsilon
MAMTMHVEVVSIEESLFSGLAECVVAPAEMGEVGIFPLHAPFVARLKTGVVRLKIPFQEKELAIFVSSGMLEVNRSGVTILSDIAIREKDVEEGNLEAKAHKAEETMKNLVSDLEYAKLEIELAKSLDQIRGLHRWRQGKKGL